MKDKRPPVQPPPFDPATLADIRRMKIKEFMTVRKLTPKDWAEKAHISPNTLYNFFNRRSDSLSHVTLEKLAAAAEVSVSHLLGEGQDDPVASRTIAIRGEVGTPRLRAEQDWDKGRWIWASIPDMYTEIYKDFFLAINQPRHHSYHYPLSADAYGLLVAGTAMDTVYPFGTLLIVEPIESLSYELGPGDFVVFHLPDPADPAQCWREVRQLVYSTVGMKDSTPGKWLMPHATKVEEQIPIKFDEDSNIRLIARVHSSYRPESNSAQIATMRGAYR